MTLVQIAEKPITVTTDEVISSFPDRSRGLPRGVLAISLRRPNSIFPRPLLDAPQTVAAGLNGDNDASIS
jgi:hypothetical protein